MSSSLRSSPHTRSMTRNPKRVRENSPVVSLDGANELRDAKSARHAIDVGDGNGARPSHAGECEERQVSHGEFEGPVAPPPFIRAFTCDHDSWFVLFDAFLTMRDIAHLYQTCRTVQRWIEQPTRLIATSTRKCVVAARLLKNMVNVCRWAPLYITAMQVNLRPSSSVSIGGVIIESDPYPEAALDVSLSDVISLLGHLPHLVHLSLQVCSADGSRVEMKQLVACLPRLRHLYFLVSGVVTEHILGRDMSSLIGAAFLEVGALTHLESFHVANTEETPSGFCFDALVQLPHLSSFSLTCKVYSDGPTRMMRAFSCTPIQCVALGMCRSLTSLNCGSWSLYHVNEYRFLDGNKDAITMFFGTMVAAKLDMSSDPSIVCAKLARSAPRDQAELTRGVIGLLCRKYKRLLELASARPATVRTSIRSFEYVDLRTTRMSSEVWDYIGRIPTLRVLHPWEWRSDISREQWGMLAQFTQLRRFVLNTSLEDDCSYRRICSEDVIPPLLHCCQLQELELSTLVLTSAQLTALVTHLSLLQWVRFHLIQLESLAPLMHATKLQFFDVQFCGPVSVGGSADVAQSADIAWVTKTWVRRSIPAIPSLCALRIDDLIRMTADQVAPFNTTLMQRLPKLSLTRFTQNLLAPDI